MRPFIRFFLRCLFLTGPSLSAQMVLQQIDEEGIPLQKQYVITTFSPTEYIKILTDSMHHQGFLEYSVDSVKTTDDKTVLYIHRGPLYYWRTIQSPSAEDAPSSILFDIGKWGAIMGRMIGKPATRASRDEILSEVNDRITTRGFPFARSALNILNAENGKIDAQIEVDYGSYIRFDSILLKGDKPLATSFLFRYLDLKKGAAFSMDMLERITTRLAALPYVELTEAKPVLSGQQMNWALTMKRKTASRFDFLIGLLPEATTKSGGTLLTGTLEGEFLNSFGYGERLYVQFEKLRPETQRLQMALRYPFLLGSPLGFDWRADFYKRDTSFLNLEQSLGLLFQIRGGDYWQIHLESNSSRLIGIDEQNILQTKKLPDQLDMKQSGIGFSFSFNRTDHVLNPRSGWLWQARLTAGNRKVIPNSKIVALGFFENYSEFQNRIRFKVQTEGSYFFPLGKISAVQTSAMMGYLGGNGAILKNELFRLGGNQNLRGFDEEAFQVSQYIVATVAYRLLISKNSYIYSFFNQAFLSETSQGAVINDQPFGLGAGMNIETGAGLFGISIAVGANKNLPLSSATPKIHLGFKNLF
jgi:outer membrane protein assembly factor BamA